MTLTHQICFYVVMMTLFHCPQLSPFDALRGPLIRWLVNFLISELYGFSSCCRVHKQAFQLTPHALCTSAFSLKEEFKAQKVYK